MGTTLNQDSLAGTLGVLFDAHEALMDYAMGLGPQQYAAEAAKIEQLRNEMLEVQSSIVATLRSNADQESQLRDADQFGTAES